MGEDSSELSGVDSLEIIASARCGACGGSVGLNPYVGFVNRLAVWRVSRANGVLDPIAAGRAFAMLCCYCVEVGRDPTEAVDIHPDGDRFVYYPLAGLPAWHPERWPRSDGGARDG